MDLKKEKRIKQEVADFDKELRDAVAKKDKAKEERLRKRKPQMDQMRLKASTGRLKVFAVTWVPFIILYYLMANIIGGYYAPVACTPFNFPLTIGFSITSISPYNGVNYCLINGVQYSHLPLLWWYFLSSLSFNTIFGKLFGTVP